MTKKYPKTLAEAHHDLAEAVHSYMTAMAAVLAPAIKHLQDEGLIDKKGRITFKGRRLIKQGRKTGASREV